jgi:hypothetical protein
LHEVFCFWRLLSTTWTKPGPFGERAYDEVGLRLLLLVSLELERFWNAGDDGGPWLTLNV